MSNNLPYKVTKKAVMTKYIPTHVQSECESKNNLCQKTTVEQFNLSRSFPITAQLHTLVLRKIAQVLNIFNKHWILVCWGQFRKINICDSSVIPEKRY